MSEMAHLQVPLKQLNIYLSNGCSLSCRHCCLTSRRSTSGSEKPYLPVVFFMQAVREALPFGLETVLLTGAEPLHHPHFDTLLDWLEKLPLKHIMIESAGNGLTMERAARLAHSGKVSISIGIDGVNAETHDAIHQAPGSFETALTAVQTLTQMGIAPQVVFSIVRRNAGQIASLVRLAEELGAASVRFSVPQISEKRKQSCYHQTGLNSVGTASVQEAAEVLQVAELIALGWRVERELACLTRLRLTFDQPPAFRGLHPSSYIDGQGRCGILNSLGVLAVGQYSLCGAGQHAPELLLGKVGADPLEQIWNKHPVLLNLRGGMPNRLEGICERCIMKTACLGNCAAENYLRNGSFWGPYWYCDAAERAGLFPAGRLIENNW